jgi:hypothetical protein
VFFLTLPTRQTTARMRIRRALQALGSPLLHGGAYLLPNERADRFLPLVDAAREHGGDAAVMELLPTDEAQRQAIACLFDRTGLYRAWMHRLARFEQQLPALHGNDAQAGCARLSRQLQSILEIDYYPGASAAQARAALIACVGRARGCPLAVPPAPPAWPLSLRQCGA